MRKRTDKKKLRERAYQKRYLKVKAERYANDPEYRERILKQERERYARRNSNFQPRGFGENAGRAREWARTLSVPTEDGAVIKMAVLTIPKLALFLSVADKMLRDWLNNEKFPYPNKRAMCGTRFYTIQEANELAKVLRDMLEGRASFRASDEDVIRQLHEVFDDLQD